MAVRVGPVAIRVMLPHLAQPAASDLGDRGAQGRAEQVVVGCEGVRGGSPDRGEAPSPTWEGAERGALLEPQQHLQAEPAVRPDGHVTSPGGTRGGLHFDVADRGGVVFVAGKPAARADLLLRLFLGHLSLQSRELILTRLYRSTATQFSLQSG